MVSQRVPCPQRRRVTYRVSGRGACRAEWRLGSPPKRLADPNFASSWSSPRGTRRAPSPAPSPRCARPARPRHPGRRRRIRRTRPPSRARAAGARSCRLPFNLGVGGAMRTGYRYALREGYDVVVQVDADGQHDPRLRPALGRRPRRRRPGHRRAVRGRGRLPARGPRRWAMRLLAAVLSRLAGTRLTDVTSGLPRRQPARRSRVFADALPGRVPRRHRRVAGDRAARGCTVCQVPVQMRPRATARPARRRCGRRSTSSRAVVALGLALVRRWPAAPRPPVRRVMNATSPSASSARSPRWSCSSRCCAASGCARSTP